MSVRRQQRGADHERPEAARLARMRDPNRIPRVLAAIERRWDERPDTHLVPLLLDVTGVCSAVKPDPLAEIGDSELVTALRGLVCDDSSLPRADPARPSRPDLMAAIAKRWNDVPDWRLGQLLVNAIRRQRPDVVPHPLFALEDGALLVRLAPPHLA
jgi:hypothetical protein